MKMSYVRIQNFRNFKDCEVNLGQNILLIGENKAGKSNFIHALRLILDPSLPDSDRYLTAQDFWDGDGQEPFNGREIKVTIRFADFADGESPELLPLAWLRDCFITHEPPWVAQLTYRYFDERQDAADDEETIPPDGEGRSNGAENYKFEIYPGAEDAFRSSAVRGMRRDMPLSIIKGQRDIASDVNVWGRSPLKRLVELIELDLAQLEPYAERIKEASDRVVEEQDALSDLEAAIQQRIRWMVGKLHTVDPTLGLSGTDPETLLESLRMFVDGDQRRPLERESLGLLNVLYLTLLSLLLEKQQIKREKTRVPFLPIVALEEPEAHLHPHLQRLVFRDFLTGASERKQPIIITTHSPHLASVANLEDLVLLKTYHGEGSVAHSGNDLSRRLEVRHRKDLERFLDITKAEVLFAKGTILVEGDVEILLLHAFAEILGYKLDEYGISVCNVYGVHFEHVVRLVNQLDIPFVVLTDGDKHQTVSGLQRGIKLVGLMNETRQRRLGYLLDAHRDERVRYWLQRSGIFVNEWTLEASLLDVGLSDELKDTFRTLGEEIGARVQAGVEYIDAYIEEPTDENMARFLDAVSDARWGKGRFAHRLLNHIREKVANEDARDIVPLYIRKGIEYVVDRVEAERGR